MSTEFIPKISLPTLNLPHFDPKLQQVDDRFFIYDFLRKKYLVLTPEEWVRQHWINFLVNYHDYPAGLFSLEKGLKYNQLNKRTDLVVFDRESKPYLLVECKAPNVRLDDNVLGQIMTYNSRLHCPLLILSNGLQHIYLEFCAVENKFLQLNSVPEKPQ